MTAHSALQSLQDVIAEEATLQAEIGRINAAHEHHHRTLKAISEAQAAAAQEVAAASKRLSETLIAAGEGGDADPTVAQARTGLQAALKTQARAMDKAAESEAHKQAITALNERARPIAERLMQIAQLKSEAAQQRVREYAEELAAEQHALAQKLAQVHAKAHALNRIAASANMADHFAPLDGSTSVILDGVGKRAKVIATFGDDIPGHRSVYLQRLEADGFNLLGAA